MAASPTLRYLLLLKTLLLFSPMSVLSPLVPSWKPQHTDLAPRLERASLSCGLSTWTSSSGQRNKRYFLTPQGLRDHMHLEHFPRALRAEAHCVSGQRDPFFDEVLRLETRVASRKPQSQDALNSAV